MHLPRKQNSSAWYNSSLGGEENANGVTLADTIAIGYRRGQNKLRCDEHDNLRVD
jgi:hypothetical protein